MMSDIAAWWVGLMLAMVLSIPVVVVFDPPLYILVPVSFGLGYFVPWLVMRLFGGG